MGQVPQPRRAALLLAALLGAGFGAYHRTPLSEPSDTNSTPPSLALSNAPLRRISEGVYELGEVRLDKAQRTVSFPCAVNMSEGTVEYALVQGTGKVHESVLKTGVNAVQIHLACLLLAPAESAQAPSVPTTPRELRGPRLNIWAEWTLHDIHKRVRLEELVFNIVTKRPMSQGPWAYSGSRVVQGTFLAERDGSVVAIIADPDALINSPRPGRDDDEIWTVNKELTPPVGTPVQVTLSFAEPDLK